ncbi:Putative multidrug resistance protein MdtD [Streptomyces glaucescens]
MTTSQLIRNQRPGAARRQGHPGIALTVIAACQLMVVLDATIVNIALPHIQDALAFSTTDLTWVVSAYTLTFGGLLLLGARAGDILGRRRVFLTGILLFTFASLLGGFAQEPWQLLAARALQGVGGAIASPTSLALITTTFAEGPERNRAFGVFAAVSAGGGAIGLLAGGMLTEWLDWRWVLFVNVPIGVLIAVLTPLYINESERHPGRFDIAGALTSTVGMASLVYGFIRAAEEGWRDSLTLTSFGTALVLLVAFVFTEMRAKEPITPLKMFTDRNRAGTYVIMLSLAAAMFGMFFYIVLFVQNVLGYSPIKAGLAFLPVTVAIVIGAGLSQRFLPVLGPKPFMVVGSAAVVIGSGLADLHHSRQLVPRRRPRPDARVRLRYGPELRDGDGDRGLRRRSERGGRGVRPAQRHPAGRRFAGPLHPHHRFRHGQQGRGGEAGAELHGRELAGAAGGVRHDASAAGALGP